MTAAFLAILVAVVSGAAGAWLQTNHERKEADRSRRISGADDFAVPASSLETACRNYAAAISASRDDNAQDPIACGSNTQRWRDCAERAQRFDDEFESLMDATYAATFRIGILFTNTSGVYEAAARIPYRLGIAKMAYSDASPTELVPASLDLASERMLDAGEARLEFLRRVRKAVYGEDEPLSFPAAGDEQKAGREPAAG